MINMMIIISKHDEAASHLAAISLRSNGRNGKSKNNI